MSFLRRRLTNTGFWVTVVGIVALGPLAATVVTTLRHAATESASSAGTILPVASQPQPTSPQGAGRSAVPARTVKRVVETPLALGGPGSGLTPTFTTLPAPEVHLDESLPTVAPNDSSANAFTLPGGRVCVLEMEEFRLRSLASANGGSSFSPELDIAGGAGQPPVRSYSASLSPDGRLYVAYIAADTAGGLGLRFVRSDNLCGSWTAPLTLVQDGDPTHGVLDAVLATGPSGYVSILYRGDRGWDPYVLSSSDFGVNWTVPVRVDTGVPSRTARVEALDLALDGSGRVYVAFTQDRFGNGASVWTATSLDGGQTFEPERNLDLMLPDHGRSERPDLRVASDGSLLLAFWDSGSAQSTGDLLFCLRSVDQGSSYVFSLVVFLPSNSEKSFPLALATAPGTQTVFLFTADDTNQLSVYRSPNDGAGFQLPATTLATSSSGSSDESRPFTRIAWARAGTTWVAGWSDQAGDTYAGLRTDVYLRASADEGVSWSPSLRADSDAVGTSTSSMESIVATGNNSVFVLFRDRRSNNDRSFDVWATRSSLSLLTLVPDYRIDTDLTPVSPHVLEGVAVAADGVARVYSAYSVVDTGPFSSIRVMSNPSCCNAVTFTVDYGSFGNASQINTGPSIAATPDGFVYLAWTSYAPGGQAEVRFNRAVVDYAQPTGTATWLGADQVVGVYPHEATLRGSTTRVVSVAAAPSSTAYVLWSSDDHVFLSKWDEANQSISTQLVDQSPDEGNNSPRFCVTELDGGPQTITLTSILLSYLGPDSFGSGTTVWSTMSQDAGLSWEPRVALPPNSGLGSVRQMEMSCGNVEAATVTAGVAYWTADQGGPDDYIFASARQGVAWSGAAQVTASAVDLRLGSPSVIGRGATITASMPYEDSLGRVYVASSFDAGVSFLSFLQLDLGAPDPDAPSGSPVAASDLEGNTWVAWLDESAGLSEVAVARLVADSALQVTATATYRASTGEPQGARANDWQSSRAMIVASGTAALAWRGEGASSMRDAVLNVYDSNDLDRDGASVVEDCNDGDASVRFVPVEVQTVTLSAQIVGPQRVLQVVWVSQAEDAGSSTTYDVVSGLLLDLRATGAFDGATCLARGVVSAPYVDIRTGPASGNAFYYLLRAVNSCGFGSFGDSSRLPDPRDQLDVPGICP